MNGGKNHTYNLQNEKLSILEISQNDILRNEQKQQLNILKNKVSHLKNYDELMIEKNSKIYNPYYFFEKLIEFWNKVSNLTNYKYIKELYIDWTNRITVGMLFFMGLRESEFIKLTPVDFSFSSLSVNIKSVKKRKNLIETIPLNHVPSSEIQLWEQFIRINNKLFSITRRQVVYRVHKFFGKKIPPHSLRHSLGLFIYESTLDIRLVQELLRHENINSTSIYTRITRKATREKLENLKK